MSTAKYYVFNGETGVLLAALEEKPNADRQANLHKAQIFVIEGKLIDWANPFTRKEAKAA